MAAHQDITDERPDLRAYARVRLAAVPVAAAVATGSPGDLTAGLAAVIIVGTLYELLTTVMVLRWPGRVSPVVLSAGDILAISVLMLASGGADSHVGYVAPGLLATVALVLGFREVAIACAAGAVALVLVCLPDLVGGEVDAWAQLAVYLATMAWVSLVYLTLAAWLARNRQRLQQEGDRRRVLLATVLEAEAAQRQALTTDLHEGPLQRMLALRQDLEEAADGDAKALALAQDGVVQAIAELRGVIAAQHPVALDHGGLRAALRALTDKPLPTAAECLEVEVEVDEQAAGLHDALVVNVARELVRNVAEHAEASRLTLTVAMDRDHALVLTVADDEVGFTADSVDEAHSIGLAAIRERVGAAGGLLELQTTPGMGTCVAVRLPV